MRFINYPHHQTGYDLQHLLDAYRKEENAMFIYLRKWARQMAWEIYHENKNEFMLEKHDKQNSVVFLTYDKAQSVIMESMWRNK